MWCHGIILKVKIFFSSSQNMTKIIRGPQDREMWDIIMKEMLYLLNASFVMVMIFNVTFNNT
jgi:hypothetical protein